MELQLWRTETGSTFWTGIGTVEHWSTAKLASSSARRRRFVRG
jgi:hypothetical protein